MSTLHLAQFQAAAVRHIVSRLRDAAGSRRILLADEVGLGKTVVAQGVIQELTKRRRNPLVVIYLCSNAEIAEQNRVKLDPNSRKPIGRLSELAIEQSENDGGVLLYSFTPGTSLKEGTGMAWERRLILYLLLRIHHLPVFKKHWRLYFQCGAGHDHWFQDTSPKALRQEFERKTTLAFQQALAVEWRKSRLNLATLVREVEDFDPGNQDHRRQRNRHVAYLRGIMQRVALRYLNPDLVILDEVQRFRDVLDEANNADHIAADLFSKRVPVLILSATPYRALTLGHEVADGGTSHHEDFFKTLDFLFDRDLEAPARIRKNLELFGERLRQPGAAEQLDHDLLKLKWVLEADLTKVICRTERNRYVLDRRKGVDDSQAASGEMPGRAELEEFFRLHQSLSPITGMGMVTEFWKSAPSLLTFLDSNYQIYRKLKEHRLRIPRALVTSANEVQSLAKRNHRIKRVIELALGQDDEPPRLWTAPTYTYYQDEYFGHQKPRKVLVFSGWRFVPKTVAIVASRVAQNRLGGEMQEISQPLRFTEKSSFHVFDICFPSPFLAEIGRQAFQVAQSSKNSVAKDVLDQSEHILKRELKRAGIQLVPSGGQRPWQVVMGIERDQGRSRAIVDALEQCVREQDDGASDNLRMHLELVREWLKPCRGPIQISEIWVKRLALVAAFSPAASLLRACQSIYGSQDTNDALPDIAALCFGSMRRYFNRPHVQQSIRQHRFRMPWRQMPSEERGYTERALVYSADAHLQAVLDEYVYLLRHAGPASDVRKALVQLGEVWTLSKGSPRTNGAKGRGHTVLIEENSEVHATHFALAFGEDIARDADPDGDEGKLRKSVVREAFNSPFWPFVLATTSVGQEGLDFHLYCKDILHWNLPSNPVDLEQREGRINRRDCLAVRQSIARDWPADRLWSEAEHRVSLRNPWLSVFDVVAQQDDVQRYKHGLFPHWIYECRNPSMTVRIQRHVPYFSTSKDAARYERLKMGLALYRLVFGQVNQEDLLQRLEAQTAGDTPEEREAKLKRIESYMLNLSPIGPQAAQLHAAEEAEVLLRPGTDFAELRRLIASVKTLLVQHPKELSDIRMKVEGLIRLVENAVDRGHSGSQEVHRAVAALAYLRNPYDHIFDHHVDGGFMDDIRLICDAWGAVAK